MASSVPHAAPLYPTQRAGAGASTVRRTAAVRAGSSGRAMLSLRLPASAGFNAAQEECASEERYGTETGHTPLSCSSSPAATPARAARQRQRGGAPPALGYALALSLWRRGVVQGAAEAFGARAAPRHSPNSASFAPIFLAAVRPRFWRVSGLVRFFEFWSPPAPILFCYPSAPRLAPPPVADVHPPSPSQRLPPALSRPSRRGIPGFIPRRRHGLDLVRADGEAAAANGESGWATGTRHCVQQRHQRVARVRLSRQASAAPCPGGHLVHGAREAAAWVRVEQRWRGGGRRPS